MPCFVVTFRDRFGEHSATKWGETPAEALARVKKSRDHPGIGATEYDPPTLVRPQPFSEESRARRAAQLSGSPL